jgi:hypothetical protein
MKTILSVTLFAVLLTACNPGNANKPETKNPAATSFTALAESTGSGRWKGTFSNGMKGATISFDVEGNEVKNLSFEGYWRCDGKLELTTIGPEKGYIIKGKAVDGTIRESGFYFELHGTFNGNKASGTLRFAFVAGGCDTYKLNWTAKKQ